MIIVPFQGYTVQQVEMKRVVDILVFLISVCGALEYHVPEEQTAGRLIGNIAYDSQLNEGMNISDFNTLRYSILTSGKYYDYFSLNQTTGNLYTAVRIDREKVCPYSPECRVKLDVTAQSTIKSYFKKIKVYVYIDDVNDHPPIFPNSMKNLSIPEDVQVGTSFSIDGAKDADTSDAFSLQSYELFPYRIPFSIQFVKNLDGTSDVRLIIKGPLDRETEDYYRLTLVAKDGGIPIQTDEMILNIKVTDVNDNAPRLSSSMFNVTVREDISIGTVIFTLSATDQDEGKNAEIVYSLSPHQSEDIKQLFSIDRTTGDLKVVQPLTYVHGKSHKVILEASDSGYPNPRTTQTYVVVTVFDTGNSPPKIHINLFPKGEMEASIPENAEHGVVVAHVLVIDQDSGNNGIIGCSISIDYTNDRLFRLENLDINEYKVIVSNRLDRETQASHLITVFCQDHGSPPLGATADFVVNLRDVNDKKPQFTDTRYRVSIDENKGIGENLLTVHATDEDIGQNGEIRYSLLEGNDTVVQIESDTGKVLTNRVYDRESRPNGFEFIVVATDKGIPPQSGTAIVYVSINDVNDRKPVFEEKLFIFRRRENRPPGTVVGRLHASDADEGDNAAIMYDLDNFNSMNVPFIVLTGGIIKTTKELDRETKPMYNFSVLAIDRGHPELTGTAQVHVYVDDDNDNYPIIDFPNNLNRSVTISFRTPPGTIVATVKAHDIDVGINSEVVFSIEGHNDTGIFKIFRSNGEIILDKSVENNAGSVFNLNIVVSDLGRPTRRTRQNLMIKISPEDIQTLQLNIVIVISIVAVTLVLSTGIILVICIIKRYDNGKSGVKKGGQVIANGVAHPLRNSNTNTQEYTAVSDDPVETERKRKEVTFSFTDNQPSALYEAKTTVGKPSTVYGDTVGPTFLKIQDDNHSETSGETNTSDSGRGLSDDEFHSTRGQSYKNKGRTKPSMEINLYSGHHAFFPDGREQLSPIELSKFTAYPPYSSKNRFQIQQGSFAPHKTLQTFQYDVKTTSSSLDDDSRSTSGIHTMEEESNEI